MNVIQLPNADFASCNPAINEEAALRAILRGTAMEVGKPFLEALVRTLAEAMEVYGAWVTEYIPAQRRLRSLAFWQNGEYVKDFEYVIDGTACESVIECNCLYHVPDNVVQLYPEDPDLPPSQAVSYLGIPLHDVSGVTIGHISVIDTKPLPADPRILAVFRIFAARAAAELQRLRAENALREREEKLRRLLGSAMDAVVEFDTDCRVTYLNEAARTLFGRSPDDGDLPVAELFTEDSLRELRRLSKQLGPEAGALSRVWIPGEILGRTRDGETFPAEVTLSCYAMGGRTYFAGILRNVNDRLEAEQRIRSLTLQAEYLREELLTREGRGEIIGNSPPMRDLFRAIGEVAKTDTTVLILGETGTGKELVAGAIHGNSRRTDGPFIKLNCGAIPANLIESEFFGHEKGAFTGATRRREGRFALADGGTLFLDEIGELSLDLQVKLLRVLQEGEFEPVGSSRTRKVNVRVITATNRNLEKEVAAGRFREDLYYRLNVFPMHVPPLRERGDDIGLLAQAFADRFAKQHGCDVRPLTPDCRRRLQKYNWPGNVRELQNVMERAVITARGGRINLDRALPDAPVEIDCPADALAAGADARVLTADELREFEKRNILTALEQCGGRVSGDNGAASLLGVKPTTLASRIKALGIRRP